ncbi:MAG: NACHT domain-containing protein, partial [Shewanella sp.]
MDNKISLLTKLNDEVRELHPVLRVLFSKLPSIKSVEYKQGPNEKGADFVLIKEDDTLLSEHYIGVVCKVGKITQSNADVDRQIDECTLFDRFVDGGKKKIKLNEVWVVTNGAISANAEEKLHEKYSKTNIKFINCEKVAALIDKFYPEYWEIDEFHNEQYFNYVNEKLNEISSGLSILSSVGINDLIEQKVISEERKEGKARPDKLYNVIMKERFVYLEGQVGAGKTTIIRQLVGQLRRDVLDSGSSLVPVILHYADIKKCGFDISNYVIELFEKYHISDAEPLIIIDGVDEYMQSIDERLKSFKSIIADVNSINESKVIITSRTMSSIDDYIVIDRAFSRYSLMPLTIRQIVTFV